MLLEELNRMWKKILSLGSNSKIEAKKIDDWFFHEEPINKGRRL